MNMQKAPEKPYVPHTAMHGPNGEYESADPQREAELRELGWIDGHEYWSRYNAKQAGLPSAADLDAVEAEKESAKPRRNKRSAQ